MTKTLFIAFTCLVLHSPLYAQQTNNFEAELRLLEKSELEAEAKEIKELENTWIEDEASTAQAATIRDSAEIKTAPLSTDSLKPVQKIRRVRSR
ncbi:MAG: hypothetical protein WC635_17585 [Bacteriovorax sp.]|jgi:hypothetical protein